MGGGTGFCTLGVVKTIPGENVTLIDQSPHQLAKAKAKPALQKVTILEGDAEDLPFPTDSFDRCRGGVGAAALEAASSVGVGGVHGLHGSWLCSMQCPSTCHN